MNDRLPILFALTITAIISALSASLLTAPAEAATTIGHNPLSAINSGNRSFLSVTVEDANKIKEVRVYFKAQDSVDYTFISLRNEVRSKYVGLLPAAAPDCKSFDYLIVVSNGKGQVVKSQLYTVKVTDNNISATPASNKVHVYTELATPKKSISGFSDNYTLETVPADKRYGTIAGLYDQRAGETVATFAGTRTASATYGISTSQLAIGGATAVTIAIGGIAINYGSSDSGGSDSGGSDDGDDSFSSSRRSCPYTGDWQGIWQETQCSFQQESGQWSGTVDGDCYFTSTKGDSGGPIDPDTGEASFLAGSQTVICDFFEQEVANTLSQATFAGDSVSGTYMAELVSGTFTGSKE